MTVTVLILAILALLGGALVMTMLFDRASYDSSMSHTYAEHDLESGTWSVYKNDECIYQGLSKTEAKEALERLEG